MSFFKKGKGTSNFYKNRNSFSINEPDIRKEVSEIIKDERRGSFLVYRRTRRDSDGNPILAEGASNTRSSESLFKNNEGMKYLFDDYMIRAYIAQDMNYHETGGIKKYGNSRTDIITVFLEAEFLYEKTGSKLDKPDELDKIIIPEYDIDGILVSPLRIREQYDIGTVQPFRLDGVGKVEFFAATLLTKFDRSNRL